MAIYIIAIFLLFHITQLLYPRPGAGETVDSAYRTFHSDPRMRHELGTSHATVNRQLIHIVEG